jgi:hypothetical protein
VDFKGKLGNILLILVRLAVCLEIIGLPFVILEYLFGFPVVNIGAFIKTEAKKEVVFHVIILREKKRKTSATSSPDQPRQGRGLLFRAHPVSRFSCPHYPHPRLLCKKIPGYFRDFFRT